jgi:hypothetical protein
LYERLKEEWISTQDRKDPVPKPVKPPPKKAIGMSLVLADLLSGLTNKRTTKRERDKDRDRECVRVCVCGMYITDTTCHCCTGRWSEEFIIKRKQKLEFWLMQLAQHPVWPTLNCFRLFLTEPNINAVYRH